MFPSRCRYHRQATRLARRERWIDMSEQQDPAEANQPGTTLSSRLEEQDQYLLHDPREIRRVLQLLVDRRSQVTVHLAPRNRMFPSALVKLAEGEDELYIDGSRDSLINEALLHTNHVTCVTMLDRVPIQFRLAGLERLDVDGLVTFRTALPASLLYLQRREYLRMRVPVSEPVLCTLPDATPASPATVVYHDLTVLDISVGGCMVAMPRECADYAVATSFDCMLHLPGAAPIPLRLRVRSRLEPARQDKTHGPRVGCEFTQLSASVESQIQRYIFRIDRLRKARERGDA